MLIVTIDSIPGKNFEVLGIVRGSTVQSRNFGHDIMAGFRTLVGGEIRDYAEMLAEARQIHHHRQRPRLVHFRQNLSPVKGGNHGR